MTRIRVHDNAHVPCGDGDGELSLSDALLVTRGITFYGRLGFLPTPDDTENEDAAAVVRGLCASFARAKRATVGALRDYLEGVTAAMRRRGPRTKRFWLTFDVAGIAYRLPVAPDKAVAVWKGWMKTTAAAVLRFLSGASDATPLVDVIAEATRSKACWELYGVFELMRRPSTYWAMRIDEGEFNQVTSAKGDAVLAAWPDHTHFHRIMQVRSMALERPLGGRASSRRTAATSYCLSL